MRTQRGKGGHFTLRFRRCSHPQHFTFQNQEIWVCLQSFAKELSMATFNVPKKNPSFGADGQPHVPRRTIGFLCCFRVATLRVLPCISSMPIFLWSPTDLGTAFATHAASLTTSVASAHAASERFPHGSDVRTLVPLLPSLAPFSTLLMNDDVSISFLCPVLCTQDWPQPHGRHQCDRPVCCIERNVGSSRSFRPSLPCG